MIQSFLNKGTEDVFNGVNSKEARKTCPVDIWNVVVRKFDMLDSAIMLDELRVPPANNLEKLKGDREGQHSIRINDKYRICFIWTDKGPDQVEIAD
jgi:toxin HigB-1